MQIVTVGSEKIPIIVIDNFVKDPDHLVGLAMDLAPFPAGNGHYYPGLRCAITPNDTESFAYVQFVCKALIPLIHSVYGIRQFDVADAGYSLVTTKPEDLQPLQSIPHFDHPDSASYAILHYLSKTPGGGTGFYRHDRTGFETLSDQRLEAYRIAREQDAREYPMPRGYHSGSKNGFTELASVEARYNRAIIYPGRLLHTALIPDDFNYSPDPRRGRLTGNIFIRARG